MWDLSLGHEEVFLAVEVCHFDRTLVFLPFLDENMGSLRVWIMVRSLVSVVRGVCGLDRIAMEYLVQFIFMVLIWVIAFELEQEYNRQSHSGCVGPYFLLISHW